MGMKIIYIFMAGLILTLALSAAGLADFTVGKTMTESFQMYNPDNTSRTNCAAANFKFIAHRNRTTIGPLTVALRNYSNGEYEATYIPLVTGDFLIDGYYNNTSIGSPFTENVRLYDIDTNYTAEAKDATVNALGPRLANISGGVHSNSTAIAALPSASTIATAVWSAGTRTLTSFGTLVADAASAVWSAVSRTVTGGTVTTTAYVNSTTIVDGLQAKLATGFTNISAWQARNAPPPPFAISTSVYNQIMRDHPGTITAAVVFANTTSGVFARKPVINGGSVTPIVRNSTRVLIFYLGTDYNLTGETVMVAARANYRPSTPYRFILPATVIDAANGVCSVTLTSKETAVVGTFYGEVALWDNPSLTGEKEVAEQFQIQVVNSVYK
jgi:hypothetical protein